MAEPMSGFKGYDFEKPVLDLEEQVRVLEETASASGLSVTDQIKGLRDRLESMKKDVYGTLSPWQRVQMARHPRRPYTLDYIERVFTDFTELHGDRHYAEDKALVGGTAYLDGNPVVVLGHQKGRTLQDSMARNFGMPHPEGYRKALRLMRMAARFRMPVLCFIDTAGAYPGIGAEERGQATAIAENLREMAILPVPIICCVIGEGGSGGALAIGVGDRLLMMENAWYSVISPEGCASILHRDATKAPQAAEALKITAQDLSGLGLVDDVVPEPLGGAHRDVDQAALHVKSAFLKHLRELQSVPIPSLLENRYQKYRVIGHFEAGQEKALKGAKKKNLKSGSKSRS
jgi:acetyl-CoA carboxylase carboxyl transferase subunit alpha